MASAYSDLHRMFLQGMMSRAIVSKAGVKHLFVIIARSLGMAISVKSITDDEIKSQVDEVNRKITLFGMQLKEVADEYDGSKFIVLVNTTDHSSVMEKVHHNYSEKERELFRLLLQAIVTGDYGSVSSTDALYLQVNGLRQGEIQDSLDKFVSDQWFLETDSGRLVPAPRCIAEFDMYFKTNLHAHICSLCSNVVFYGVFCQNCEAIVHKHCFHAFNSRRGERKCNSCKKPIGEDAVNGEAEEEAPQPRKGKGSGAGHSRSSARGSGGSDTPQNTPGPSQEETPAASQDTPAPTRGRRKRPNSDS